MLRCGRFGLAPLGHAQTCLSASLLPSSARPLPRGRWGCGSLGRRCGRSRFVTFLLCAKCPKRAKKAKSKCACCRGCTRWLAVEAAVRAPPSALVRGRGGAPCFLPRTRVKIGPLVRCVRRSSPTGASRYTPALPSFLPLFSGTLARPSPRPWAPLCGCFGWLYHAVRPMTRVNARPPAAALDIERPCMMQGQ